MKYLLQFLIIVTIAFLGEVLHYLIHFPISASIYGIILLFIALELKWVKVKDIREVTMFLLAVMPVIFVPPAVGLIDSWDVIAHSLIPYIIITVVSTFVVMAVAGWVTQYAIRRNSTMSKTKQQEG